MWNTRIKSVNHTKGRIKLESQLKLIQDSDQKTMDMTTATIRHSEHKQLIQDWGQTTM